MTTRIYPACFYKDIDGYSVIFPDLNWLATDGKNLEEAMRNAIDCLAGYLYYEEKENKKIPKPTDISKIDPIKIAKELDPNDKSIDGFVNYVSVDIEKYAKEHFEKSVKKTLTIPVWLNELAIEKNINFSKVLQEALMKILL